MLVADCHPLGLSEVEATVLGRVTSDSTGQLTVTVLLRQNVVESKRHQRNRRWHPASAGFTNVGPGASYFLSLSLAIYGCPANYYCGNVGTTIVPRSTQPSTSVGR